MTLYIQIFKIKAPDDFTRPLKLMAKRLCFTDPITHIKHDISCEGFEDF